jgi:signal transduction histidine kinase/ActR/RegA family two-component response regulator
MHELRVLWIEDGPLDEGLGNELLRVAGVDAVERCSSLPAALARVESGGVPTPTVLLLDARLAEGEALEVFDRLVAAQPPPVVVLGPEEDPDRARVLIERGAQDFLVRGETSGAALARSLRQAALRAQGLAVLRASRDRALQVADARSAFAAAISHEIRTPLNAILGMSDLLAQTQLDLDQREYVEIFRRCGRSLLGLLDNALELSRLENGRIDLVREPFELDALLHECLESFAFTAHRKGLALVGEVADEAVGTVVGDEGRLRQVLFNLVGNAVKFTESGRVVLRAQPADAPGEIALEVEDTGIGIPVERHRAIFERFVQAESGTTRRYGGSGLGLALCRELARAMGGRIDVESAPGAGSHFRVVLPLAVQPRAAAGGDLAGLRVRVLLADAVERGALAARLRRRGAEVEEIADVEGAERRLGAPRAGDALVLDARLRGGGGLEHLERIRRAEGAPPQRRVVLLPMDHRIGDLARCAAAGATALTKPVRWEDLEAALRGTHVAAHPVAWDSAVPRFAGRRILVAEDVEENRLIVQRYLEPTGADVEVALDGREAVERCDARHYDLVLMDIHMPLLDGCEATRRIRSRERETGRSRTPIVALTADALPEQRAACLTAGCDGHLGKPFTREDLYRLFRQLLGAPAAESAAEPVPAPRPTPAADERPEIPPELADLAEEYLTNRRRDAETLHEAARRRAWEQARRLGHNMKGSGAGYGFRRVSELGAEIEWAAARGDAAALQRVAAALSAYAEKALAELG